MPSDETRIRESMLNLIPGVGEPFLVLPSPTDVATRSGADLHDVTAIMSSMETCLEFLLAPLAADAERTMNTISISRNPSLDEQAAIIRHGIRIALRHPAEIRLLLLLLDRQAQTTANRMADTILYSTGLRLIGIDHEPDPVQQQRVTLAWELVTIAVISHRHGLETTEPDDDVLESVVTACLGILHPPTD